MKCGGCVFAVQSALEQLPACHSVSVDLQGGKAEVEGELEPERVVETLTNLGYPATLLE